MRDLAWVAGFVEGEGCFAWNGKSPRLTVTGTDPDVMGRFASITKRRVRGPIEKGGNRKQQYVVDVYGPVAAGWMMTLLPMLGSRRKRRAIEVLSAWRSRRVAHKQTFWIKNGGAVRAAGGMF